MSIKAVLFDLDGTLLNTIDDFAFVIDKNNIAVFSHQLYN